MNIQGFLSQEERNLYNPAYIGAILYHSIRECQKNNPKGLHCALAYIVIPLAVSNRYSEILPKTLSTPIAGWTANHEGNLIGFGESVNAFIDIVNAAILFLLERKAISLSHDGFFLVADDKMPRLPALISNNWRFKHAFLSCGFVGRWFSGASSIEIIYTHLGVRP